jgi:hypothetical protein
MCFSKSEFTKNNKPIYDIAINRLPEITDNIIIENNPIIKNNTSSTIVHFEYSHYIKFDKLEDNIIKLSRNFDLSNSNVFLYDVINFVSKTFVDDIKKSFQYENLEHHPWLQIYQKLSGFYVCDCNTTLHIYPHFTDL